MPPSPSSCELNGQQHEPKAARGIAQWWHLHGACSSHKCMTESSSPEPCATNIFAPRSSTATENPKTFAVVQREVRAAFAFLGGTSVQHRAEFPLCSAGELGRAPSCSAVAEFIHTSICAASHLCCPEQPLPPSLWQSLLLSNHPQQLLMGDNEIFACPRSAQLTHAEKTEARTGKLYTVLLPAVIKEIRMKLFTLLPQFLS